MPSVRLTSITAGSSASVCAFMEALEHPHKAGIETLRRAILGADPRIAEEIKWNAPSYKVQDHFLTFKLFPPKAIQLVFHVGAKPVVPARAFTLDLPAKWVKWAAKDRCVLTVVDSQQAEEVAPLVAQAASQWLAQLIV